MLQTNRIIIINNGKNLPNIKEFYLRCSSDALFPLVEVKDVKDIVTFYIPERITTENGKTYFFVKEIVETLSSSVLESTTNVVPLRKK